ncbi:lysophospholipase catalytic domain-domain-containing protein [Protomyces lactucae-debilis]|uniref:Lysophospholipase n=1 Tax=Protomyces lactucae-debilis TaxID=2754530 RepID=A0A1Y2FU89_PROLT|nr:lysophospholipase catalytic domain-containing protein [Protomyces lactucae-debilis]ORY86265.1 lysophospholipase catalytic domain-domain-containing protein [Protomyces lactucae-debilis]
MVGASFLAVAALTALASIDAQSGYKPRFTSCPSQLIRSASTISPEEAAYLTSRAPQAQAALRSFITSTSINSSVVDQLFSTNRTIPRISYAASGGGLRAMVFGGSIFRALDARSDVGTMGGVLQGCQYMAGLSGGSWLIGSTAVNDFATVDQLVKSNWDIDNVRNLIFGGILSTARYYTNIVESVQAKNDAGFFTSITDYWGRVISYHVLNPSNGLPGFNWADIRNVSSFVNHSMPFPLVVSVGREPGTIIVELNATNFEFNPYELGSWDVNLYSFTPVQYLGTSMQNGQPKESNRCVQGFDNAGFTIGTSSSLFNGALTQINGSNSGSLTGIITNLLQGLSESNNDIAVYPNPFQGLNNISSSISNTPNLTLTDGGLDNQNIPLWPLIQPEREVDAIFAVDSSADTTYNWPNGSSLVHTYRRVTEAAYRTNKSISFPYVPDFNTFINLGLNRNVTFFGCNGTNGTLPGVPPPLIIYIPNAPFSHFSNFSTFDGTYPEADIQGTLNNGLNIMTNGNSTAFKTCIACAIMQRGLERANLTQPDVCRQCFSQHCWSGVTNSTQPGEALLAPTLLANAGFGGRQGGAQSTGSSRAAASSSSTARSSAGQLNVGVDGVPGALGALLLAGIVGAIAI